MVTIQDVAKLAGVAPVTVSRYINKSGYCGPETRARVEAAIAQLDYVPNRLASGLRSRRTNTLALVLTDITNPFFTTIARGVEDTANEAGYVVIFCNTDESIAKEKKYLQMLMELRADGVILVPASGVSESVDFIQKQDTPVVVLDRKVLGANADMVRCDSEQGAYELTRLLISLGHRYIKMLGGPIGTSTAEDRVAGYQRSMEESGLVFSTEQVYRGGFTQQSGYEMTILAMSKDPKPTAFFAANNFIAIGALKALQAINIRVPDDVALVSFDDLPSGLITFPFLTVAAQPAYEMGQKATEILLTRLSNLSPQEFQEIILPAEIVIRKSSGNRVVQVPW